MAEHQVSRIIPANTEVDDCFDLLTLRTAAAVQDADIAYFSIFGPMPSSPASRCVKSYNLFIFSKIRVNSRRRLSCSCLFN